MIQTVVRHGVVAVVIGAALCACEKKESAAGLPDAASDAGAQAAAQVVEGLAAALGADDPAQWKAAGSTELHMAVSLGRTEQARTLLAQKVHVNAKDRNGQTPLHLAACALAGWSSVDLLLAAGADLNAVDNAGRTPLLLALESSTNDVPERMVRRLVAAKANVNAVDANLTSPVHLAAERGHLRCLAALLAAGAKPGTADGAGMTPLHFAALNGHAEAATALLKAGAEVLPRDKRGWSPLIHAANWANWDVYDVLEKAGAKEETWTPLHIAAIVGDVDAARQALAGKAMLNSRDRIGRTPLAWAAACFAEDVARELIGAGADLRMADTEGLAPVHLAARSGSIDVIRQLVAAAVPLAVLDADRWMPMHYAARGGHGEMVRMLLEAGSPPDAMTKDGWRPLLLLMHARKAAARDKRVAIDASVEALIKAGANVLACDPDGQDLRWLANGFPDALQRSIRTAVAERRDEKFERAVADFAAAERPAFMSQPASTPQAAVRKMFCALHRGEVETLLSCFQASADEADLLVALVEFARIQTAFRAAMIRAYDKTGWLEFQGHSAFTLVLPAVDDAAVRDALYEVNGDQATCQSLSGFKVNQLSLVRRDQNWLIETASLLNGQQPVDAAKGMRAMAQALTEAQKMVGQAGLGPDGIGDHLAERMFGFAPAQP